MNSLLSCCPGWARARDYAGTCAGAKPRVWKDAVRRPRSERRRPFLDQRLAALEMHRVLDRERSAPIPAMAVEDRRDEGQPELDLVVATRIQDLFEGEVDRRAPGVVRDLAGAAAHEAAAQHARGAEHAVDVRLLLLDVGKHLAEARHRG